MRVAFVVNGPETSAMAVRARAFAARLGTPWNAEIAYRSGGRLGSATAFLSWLGAIRPAVVWVFDVAVAGVLAGACNRALRRTPLVIDTGDAVGALARTSGIHGPLGAAFVSAFEKCTFRRADHIVVRGSFHRELLARQGVVSTFIPDGVDLSTFQAVDGAEIRRAYAIRPEALVVGLVGSSTWSPRLRMAYGWDLVEALALLRDEQVIGLLVGDGSGIAHLQQRARELGVETRLRFVGRQPYERLPSFLSACDVCLSTQTNDLPGNVRTTGKLPLYMACGRYVLATDVGEASRVLPAEMRVPYEGTLDRGYPRRLAERIGALARNRQELTKGARLVDLARAHFDYDVLARRVNGVLSSLQLRPDALVQTAAVRDSRKAP